MTEKVPGVNLEVRLKCSKGTKMTKAVKTLAAILPFATKADRKQYAKLVAKTQHDAAFQAKYAKVDRGGNPNKGVPAPGAARNLRPGEASTAE
jgi:hypothetical protein